MTSPDTWTAPDWRDFGWYGVCDCGRLRHEHAVLDDSGMVTDVGLGSDHIGHGGAVTARCDAGHQIRIEDIP